MKGPCPPIFTVTWPAVVVVASPVVVVSPGAVVTGAVVVVVPPQPAATMATAITMNTISDMNRLSNFTSCTPIALMYYDRHSKSAADSPPGIGEEPHYRLNTPFLFRNHD